MRKLLLICLLSLGLATAVFATPVTIDVPAQPTPDALLELARQTGWNVLFPADELRDRQSPAVVGHLEPVEALSRLLAGSGFEGEQTGERRLIVRRVRSRGPVAPSPGEADRARESGDHRAEEASALFRMNAVIVTPGRYGVADTLALPSTTIRHDDLAALPQLGEDLFRAVGVLPGMATLDYSAKFWLRGAPNEQVLTRLDGMTLVEPYHMRDIDGALSIIDLETVARVDVLAGGFTAEYGDRQAGVFLMETDSYGAAEPHTRIGLSLTGLRATHRASFDGGRGSYLVSGRFGFPDVAIEMIGSGDNSNVRYYDAFAKVEYRVAPGHTVGLHVLHASDTSTFHEVDDPRLRSDYGNDNAWLRWRGTFGDRLTGETVLGYAANDTTREADGRFDDALDFVLDDRRTYEVASLRSDWSYLLADPLLLRAGFDLADESASYSFFRDREDYVLRDGRVFIESSRVHHARDLSATIGGVHGAVRWQPLPEVTVEAGLRQDTDHVGDADWSPRLAAAWDVGPATVRAAWGVYHQRHGLNELEVVDNDPTLYPAEEAEQQVFGVEVPVGRDLLLRADYYERTTDNPRPHGVILNDAIDVLGDGAIRRILLFPTSAQARGVELVAASRGDGPLTWSASYAWSRTTETLSGDEVPRRRDQRNTVNLAVKWEPNPRWQFSTAWQFHSGWPATDQQFFPYPLADGGTTYYGQFGAYNAERLPDYHRLDLRATRTWQLRGGGTLRAFLDVFNAYNRDNVDSIRNYPSFEDGQLVTVHDYDELFPIVPTVGLIWDF